MEPGESKSTMATSRIYYWLHGFTEAFRQLCLCWFQRLLGPVHIGCLLALVRTGSLLLALHIGRLPPLVQRRLSSPALRRLSLLALRRRSLLALRRCSFELAPPRIHSLPEALRPWSKRE